MKTGQESFVMFNYDCNICGKNTIRNEYKRYPVIYKPTKETLLICETCLSFIKDCGQFSSYEIIKTTKEKK